MVAGNVTEGGCWDERAATQRGTGSTNDVHVVNHRPQSVLHSCKALELVLSSVVNHRPHSVLHNSGGFEDPRMHADQRCMCGRKGLQPFGVTSRREEEQSPKCCR